MQAYGALALKQSNLLCPSSSLCALTSRPFPTSSSVLSMLPLRKLLGVVGLCSLCLDSCAAQADTAADPVAKAQFFSLPPFPWSLGCSSPLTYISQVAFNLVSRAALNETLRFYREDLGFTIVSNITDFNFSRDGKSFSDPFFIMRIPGMNTSTIEPIYANGNSDRAWIEFYTTPAAVAPYNAAKSYLKGKGFRFDELKVDQGSFKRYVLKLLPTLSQGRVLKLKYENPWVVRERAIAYYCTVPDRPWLCANYTAGYLLPIPNGTNTLNITQLRALRIRTGSWLSDAALMQKALCKGDRADGPWNKDLTWQFTDSPEVWLEDARSRAPLTATDGIVLHARVGNLQKAKRILQGLGINFPGGSASAIVNIRGIYWSFYQ